MNEVKADGHTLCGACGCLLFPTDSECPMCKFNLLGPNLSDDPWENVFARVEKQDQVTFFTIWVTPKGGEQISSRLLVDNEELAQFPWTYARALNTLIIEIKKALRKKNMP